MKPSRVITTRTDQLPVDLTDDEVFDRGRMLAQLNGQLVDHNGHAKKVKQELTQEKTSLETEIVLLAKTVRERKELRPVEVQVKQVNAHEVHEFRTDTGEILIKRAITDHERQVELLPPPPRSTDA